MSNGSALDAVGVEREKGLEGVEASRRRFGGGDRSRDMREVSKARERKVGGEADGVMREGRGGPSWGWGTLSLPSMAMVVESLSRRSTGHLQRARDAIDIPSRSVSVVATEWHHIAPT